MFPGGHCHIHMENHNDNNPPSPRVSSQPPTLVSISQRPNLRATCNEINGLNRRFPWSTEDERWVGQLMKGRDVSKPTKKNPRSALAMSQTTKGTMGGWKSAEWELTNIYIAPFVYGLRPRSSFRRSPHHTSFVNNICRPPTQLAPLSFSTGSLMSP